MLVEGGITIGVDTVAIAVQKKLAQKQKSCSETAMEDSSDSACDLESADIDSIFGFLLNV